MTGKREGVEKPLDRNRFRAWAKGFTWLPLSRSAEQSTNCWLIGAFVEATSLSFTEIQVWHANRIGFVVCLIEHFVIMFN